MADQALITEYRHDRAQRAAQNAPPPPGTMEAFVRLVETGWDLEATARLHGRTPRW